MRKKLKKIYFVEDDPFLIDIYKEKFKKEKFKVIFVEDGQTLLRKLEKEIPDLLILDIVLPGLDGWQILENIRKNKKYDKMKIIIFTNLGKKEEIEKGLKYGVQRYLIKAHYTPSQILKIVKEVLEI